MCRRRWFVPALVLVAGALTAVPSPLDAQLLKKLRDKVEEAKNAVDDARSLRCEAQGVCGDVSMSDLFEPGAYESLAVVVFDGTGRFGDAGTLGLVGDHFQRRLLENGYLLAASADAEEVRGRMARGNSWTDEELAQLRDFIHNIDAVLVVDVRSVEFGACEIDGRPATQVTLHMSARWLHVDVGDVPWVATHDATVCERGGAPDAQAAVLETVASQLVTTLPVRGTP